MKLYFARAELLLQKEGDQYALSKGSELLGRYTQEKKAVSEFNRIRRELEKELPPTEPTEAERRQVYEAYVAKSMMGRNLSDKKPKSNKSRTYG